MKHRTTAIGRIPHALHLIDSPVGKTPFTLDPEFASWLLEGVALLSEVPELYPLATYLTERLPRHSDRTDAVCLRELEQLKSRASELFCEHLEAALLLLENLDIGSNRHPLDTYRLLHRDRILEGMAVLRGITQLASDAQHLLRSAVLVQRCFTRHSYGYFVAELQALKDEARALADEIAKRQARSAGAAAA